LTALVAEFCALSLGAIFVFPRSFGGPSTETLVRNE